MINKNYKSQKKPPPTGKTYTDTSDMQTKIKKQGWTFHRCCEPSYLRWFEGLYFQQFINLLTTKDVK